MGSIAAGLDKAGLLGNYNAGKGSDNDGDEEQCGLCWPVGNIGCLQLLLCLGSTPNAVGRFGGGRHWVRAGKKAKARRILESGEA